MQLLPSIAVPVHLKATVSLVFLAGALTLAEAQVTTTLYEEDWGAGYASVPGNVAATTLPQVGWTNVGGQYTGMYGQNGAFDVTTGVTLSNRPCYFSSANVSEAAIMYTTNGAGNGGQGTASFASLDPATNSGLFLSVASQVNQNNTFGVSNYFAVNVGGAWYVSVNRFTNNSVTTGPTFARNTLLYNPDKTNWNNLTVGPPVTVGGQAAANLSGTIDGIGIVQVWGATISGNTPGFNYLNLTVAKPIVIPPDPSAPVINAAGYSQTTYERGVASFAVNASIGTPTLNYFWSHDGGTALTNGPTGTGSTVFGAATSQITISNVSATDAGTYSVIVSNATGIDDSLNYVTNTLTVLPTGPEILYAENFPFVGPFSTGQSVTNVGWRTTIPATATPNRLDVRGDVYAYETAARTMGFFTATNFDTGLSGLTFPPTGINPASYPFVSFRASYATPLNPANASVYFAVQMAGGQWYVSTSPNQLGGTPAAFTSYGLEFSPTASGWNRLTTVNFNGNVVVGTPPASDLSGNITGVGLVLVFTGPSLYLINNVSLVTNSTPPVLPSFPSLPNVPYPQTVYAGGGASFSFTEAGTLPFTNHWDLNQNFVLLTDGTTASGSIISGSETTRITIQNVSQADAGLYRGIVSNPAGTTNTGDANTLFGATPLTVIDPPLGLIYTESFPQYAAAAGNQPLNLVGWTNQSDSPNRMFHNGPATSGTFAAFAYQGGTTNSLFYASTESDSGASGLPFIAFNPANYPNGSLQFSAGFASGNAQFIYVSASFAVKIGGTWYVNATPVVPTNSALTGAYTVYSQTMDFTATNWNVVTLAGTQGVSIGGQAPQNLSGPITAAGLLFQHTFVVTVPPNFGGSMNFNSFAIQANGITGDNLLGGVNIGSRTNGAVDLTWIGNPSVKLQSATNLTAPIWQDVPNTLGFHLKTINPTLPQEYFRLTGPTVP